MNLRDFPSSWAKRNVGLILETVRQGEVDFYVMWYTPTVHFESISFKRRYYDDEVGEFNLVVEFLSVNLYVLDEELRQYGVPDKLTIDGYDGRYIPPDTIVVVIGRPKRFVEKPSVWVPLTRLPDNPTDETFLRELAFHILCHASWDEIIDSLEEEFIHFQKRHTVSSLLRPHIIRHEEILAKVEKLLRLRNDFRELMLRLMDNPSLETVWELSEYISQFVLQQNMTEMGILSYEVGRIIDDDVSEEEIARAVSVIWVSFILDELLNLSGLKSQLLSQLDGRTKEIVHVLEHEKFSW